MTSIEREILQDLIDGNADVGPDGGIWYPSGPSDVSVSRLFAALVEKVRESERLLAASCEETRANFSELYRVGTGVLPDLKQQLAAAEAEARTLSKMVDWLAHQAWRKDGCDYLPSLKERGGIYCHECPYTFDCSICWRKAASLAVRP